MGTTFEGGALGSDLGQEGGLDIAQRIMLLRGGIPEPGGIWANLASGTGAFTLALARLLGEKGEIYSVESDRAALREQERVVRHQLPAVYMHYISADFTRPLDLPKLDGLVIAQALHTVPDQGAVARLLRTYLRSRGRLIVVEYNGEAPAEEVPYPVPFAAWEQIAASAGFRSTRLLATVSDATGATVYSAASLS